MRLSFLYLLQLIFRFNPRICKRCDFRNVNAYQRYLVSIHASVKDATSQCLGYSRYHGFNPRICKRCDQGVAPLVGLTTYVSIHASVKDATYWFCLYSCSKGCFNPRICKRCDSLRNFIMFRSFVSIHASVKDATPCL